MRTREEEKTIQSLKVMEISPNHEINREELKGSYLRLSKIYRTEDKSSPYYDGRKYDEMKDAYDFLYDHEDLLRETIHNLLDPTHETHEWSFSYIYEKEEAKTEPEKPQTSEMPRAEVHIVDKPSFINILLSFFSPVIGIVLFALGRKIVPKASKFYLASGILGFVLSFVLMLFI